MAAPMLFGAPGQYAVTILPNPYRYEYSYVMGFNERSDVLTEAPTIAHSHWPCTSSESMDCFGAFWSEKDGYHAILPPGMTTAFARFLRLNDRGEVAGRHSNSGATPSSIFLWSLKEGIRDLAPTALWSAWSPISALNNKGEIAGDMLVYGTLERKTYLVSEKAPLRSIPLAPASMNDQGEAVGGAFYWSEKDGVVDIGRQIGASATFARSIDKQGRVFGTFQDAASAEFYFYWQNRRGLLYTLPVPAGCSGRSDGNAGIVGVCGSPGASRLWTYTPKGGFRDLGLLGYDAILNAANDRGEFVGSTRFTPGAPRHAFFWSASTKLVDLDPDHPTRESVAKFLNDAGVIAGEIAESYENLPCIWKR